MKISKQEIQDKYLATRKKPINWVFNKKNIILGKVALGSLAFIILMVIFYNLIEMGVSWFRLNTIVFSAPISIKFNKPVTFISLKELSIQESNNALIDQISDDVIKQYLNPDSLPKCTDSVTQINPTQFFDDVAMKESSNGKETNPKSLNNYCKSIGKSNIIGYDPQDKFCFGSLEESQLYVAYYVKKNCSNLTLSSCECMWNGIPNVNSCAYSENNLSMAK